MSQSPKGYRWLFLFMVLKKEKEKVTCYLSYYSNAPRDAAGQLIFAFQKMLRFKSVRFFCKVIPKSLRFSYMN
jgi:hypothetical protein